MNNNKWFLNGGRGSGRTFRLLCETYENKIAELEKENAELKSISDFQTSSNMDRYFQLKRSKEQLTKAKELLKQFLNAKNGEDTYKAEWEAEQFLNSEVEK